MASVFLPFFVSWYLGNENPLSGLTHLKKLMIPIQLFHIFFLEDFTPSQNLTFSLAFLSLNIPLISVSSPHSITSWDQTDHMTELTGKCHERVIGQCHYVFCMFTFSDKTWIRLKWINE